MPKAKRKTETQEFLGQLELTRLQLAKAEDNLEAAKQRARVAKRRRKEAKQAARRARKEVKRAKGSVVEAREAIAKAEANLALLGKRPAKTRKSSVARIRTVTSRQSRVAKPAHKWQAVKPKASVSAGGEALNPKASTPQETSSANARISQNESASAGVEQTGL